MKILVSYRGIPQSPGWATGDMVVKAFRALGHEVTVHAKYYQRSDWVEPLSWNHKDYDLLLFMECNDDDVQYPELRLVRARKTACWLFDASYYADKCEKLVSYFNFNHVFLANPLVVNEYRAWGHKRVHYLPYACDRDLHFRPLDFPKRYDLALVGSIRQDRIKLQKELAKAGIHLELIGEVFREQYIDALASAKIIINQNPEAGLGLLNMRHFEAQAAGCRVIEQWNDLKPNIESGFRSFVARYDPHNIGDLIQQIVVCSSPSLHSFQEAFLQENTYKNRCEEILKTVFQ